MHEIRDMENEAARIAAMTPEERAAHDAALAAHRRALGLDPAIDPEVKAVADMMPAFLIAGEFLVERKRQLAEEGWTLAHDDEHRAGELAKAAACYAVGWRLRDIWPWDERWWKPKDSRRNLIRAGTLIMAEIERIDRDAATKATKESTDGRK